HISISSISLSLSLVFSLFFFFNDPPTSEIYPLSLHDALPISYRGTHITVDLVYANVGPKLQRFIDVFATLVLLFVVSVQKDECRSEEHTSELQSLTNLVCRLLLEKKKKTGHTICALNIIHDSI